jgi:23S rRNA (cytosine1962-C5)-methyltransferase
MGTIVIKAGREKSIRRQHPWIFSGAIEKVQDDPQPGAIVTIVDGKDRFLARGYWNEKSQIQVRILTWQDEPIDEAWWKRMLARAIAARLSQTALLRGQTTGFRLINAENDYLPGLVVDYYAGWMVVQALTLHIDQHKVDLAQWLAACWAESGGEAIQGVYERSDVDVRGKEGLRASTGLLYGAEPPAVIAIQEGGLMQYQVDVRAGHKTGFYLDQRLNRQLLHDLIVQQFDTSRDLRLLNLFSYTGGFGIAGLQGGFGRGVYIANVDASHEALELAESNFQLNFGENSDLRDYQEAVEFIQADVFDYLRDQVAEKAQYDVIICDPPKFAHNAGQVERAARGYKDLNLNCFKLIKSGGYLMTFSCSGAITQDLFQKIVFGALEDSGRQAQILQHLGPGPDHPIALTFPEGTYLKGLLLRVY